MATRAVRWQRMPLRDVPLGRVFRYQTEKGEYCAQLMAVEGQTARVDVLLDLELRVWCTKILPLSLSVAITEDGE
jgi:hypothetical protein